MQPLIDILVPNFMTADFILNGIIEPLRDHLNKAFRLTIIDDGSPTDELALLKSYKDSIYHLERHPTRLGCAPTFNALLDCATAKYVFLCNSDIVIPNAQELKRLCQTLDALPAPAILGVAEGPRFLDDIAKPYTHQPDDGGIKPCHQDYASACAMLMLRTTLPPTAEFDLAYTGGFYEDTDFCFSLRAKGWDVYFVQSRIWHIGHQAMFRLQTTARDDPSQLNFLATIEHNRALFVERWGKYLNPKTDFIETALANYHLTNDALREDTTKC